MARQRSGAPSDGVRRVIRVDNSNVPASFAFFRAVVEEVAADHPDVEMDHRYSDAAAHDLVTDPSHFDVVATENLLGDLLSDLGAATVGGLGMCGSADIGTGTSYVEPIHGSAPTIAGTDRANPTSQVQRRDDAGPPGRAGGGRPGQGRGRRGVGDGAVDLSPQGQPSCGTRGVAAVVAVRLAG